MTRHGGAGAVADQIEVLPPRVDLVRPPSAIGRNTEHAMQSGLLFGYVGLVEGMDGLDEAGNPRNP